MVKETKNVFEKPKHSLDVNRDGGKSKSKSKRNKGAVMSTKFSWKGLVGLPGKEAEKMIKEYLPHLVTRVHTVTAGITCEWRSNRVRIFIDSSGKVANPPTIG